MRSRWIAALSFSIVLTASLAVSAPRTIIEKVTWYGSMPDIGEAVRSSSLLTPGGRFTADLLRRELSRIDSLSFMAGFAGCEVGVDTVRSEKGLDVSVEVRQGERTVIGDVNVSGDSQLGAGEILRELGLAKGDAFDPARLGEGAGGLVAGLGERGHPFAQVWITGFRYDRGSNSVDLSVSIYEGDAAQLSRVVFEGLARTDSSLAQRLSRLRPGSPFRESSLKRARRYLRASRLFESVGQPRVIRRDASRVDVAVPLKEREKANSFSGAFGFSRKEDGEYRANGAVELVLTNIAGRGRDISFDWLNDGRKYSRSRLQARDRMLLSTPLEARVDLGQTVNDTLYDMVSAGVFVSFPLGPAWSAGAGIAGDRTVFNDATALERSSRQRYRAGVGRDGGGAFVFRLDLEGAVRRNEYEESGSRTDEQLIYAATLSTLLPTTGSQSVAGRLEARGVVSKGAVTLAEMFPLGGARSLRGYRENQFRGEQTGFLSLEYRFGGESRLFFFDDVGAFLRRDDGWTVKNGFGFGLRSSSRAGTVELSFGLGEKIGLSETKIHISLVESF